MKSNNSIGWIATKLFLATFLIFFLASAYAEEVTVVYTGKTYSSLYPCGICPASVGGGITRRASAIKELRDSEENIIVLDSGNFTAASPFDSESINPAMDKKRSLFYCQAMEKIGYDVVGVGENELNFGADFLKDNIKRFSFKCISSNIDMEGVLPYYIKELPGLKIGIIGLSTRDIYKKSGLKVGGYDDSLRKAIKEIKAKCDFIILISSVDDKINFQFAKEIPEIKMIFSSGRASDSSLQTKIGQAVLFRPSAGGKSLGIVRIQIDGRKILGWKFEEKKLSLSVKEDAEMKGIIPACFTNDNCPSREGLIAKCRDAGSPFSFCAYYDVKKLDAFIITDKGCSFCSTEASENLLKDNFLGIRFKTIDYRQEEAKRMIKDQNITTLPAFVIDSAIKEEKHYHKFRAFFEELKRKKVLLKKELSGICLFLNREEIPKRIDLFLNFYKKGAADIFDSLVKFSKENKINLETHFIVPGDTEGGYPEEEVKVALAVRELYPKEADDYIYRRIKNIKNGSWMGTADEVGVSYEKIKEFVSSPAMEELGERNQKFAQELAIRNGNVVLVKNNRIFQVFSIDKEELKSFFKGGE